MGQKSFESCNIFLVVVFWGFVQRKHARTGKRTSKPKFCLCPVSWKSMGLLVLCTMQKRALVTQVTKLCRMEQKQRRKENIIWLRREWHKTQPQSKHDHKLKVVVPATKTYFKPFCSEKQGFALFYRLSCWSDCWGGRWSSGGCDISSCCHCYCHSCAAGEKMFFVFIIFWARQRNTCSADLCLCVSIFVESIFN